MQNRAKVATILLLYLTRSPLYPIKALATMLASSRQDHMLSLPKVLTFHDFRCGDHAFRHGSSVQDIQVHGTWSSSAVWQYIQ